MRWAVVVLLSGCSSILGIDDFKLGDAGGGNEGIDAETGYCLGPTGYRVCLMAAPTNAPINITQGAVFDTVSSPLCAPTQPMSWKMANQPDACFIIAPSVTFNAPTMIQATGGRPLVVFASDTITVTTHIDVASHATIRGPASPSLACTPPTAAQNGAQAAPGGAGGSFMTRGGDGGNSSQGGQAPGRGAAADAGPPQFLRGGCPGGVGANTSTQQGGQPGSGGGALYLVAANRITINGFINASGSAGQPGGNATGGGGAGSGGMVVLHAPAITGNGGVIIANGGGGSSGGGANGVGVVGAEPSPSSPLMAAAGGITTNGGGTGGAGFAGPNQAAFGGVGAAGAPNGGGGGGGGGGYIRANIAAGQITTSPAISVVP